GLLATAAGGTAAGDVLVLGPLTLEHLGRHRAHDDGDVAGALADAGGASPGTGTPAVQRAALVGVAGRHVEGLGVDLVVVLGVGHRGVEALADDLGRGALGVGEHVAGLGHRLVADEVEHGAGLGGRHAHVL